jgi:hypothetical protein
VTRSKCERAVSGITVMGIMMRGMSCDEIELQEECQGETRRTPQITPARLFDNGRVVQRRVIFCTEGRVIFCTFQTQCVL